MPPQNLKPLKGAKETTVFAFSSSFKGKVSGNVLAIGECLGADALFEVCMCLMQYLKSYNFLMANSYYQDFAT